MYSGAHGRAPFLASQSLLWVQSVRPYNRLQDSANLERETWNLERETRWSKTSGRGASHTPDPSFWILISSLCLLPVIRSGVRGSSLSLVLLDGSVVVPIVGREEVGSIVG